MKTDPLPSKRPLASKRHRSLRKVLALCALLGSASVANCANKSSNQSYSNGFTAGCHAFQPTVENGWEKVDVGNIWSGVHTAIGTADAGNGVIVAAYYAPNREMTVDLIDLRRGLVCGKQLPSVFGGWDAHNSISVAISSDGIVHIVGNMHASPMFYAAGSISDVNSIQPRTMVGRDEESTTYPQFLRGPNNELYFLYRSGHAGNGEWIVNEWQGGRWLRVGPIFSDRDSRGPVSAYPTEFKLGSDGRFHVAIVWRRTYDINSNFAVTYASTSDFRHWYGAGGESFTGLLGPESLPPIDVPGENNGLVNNEVLVLDKASRPTVIYSRYGSGGLNGLFAAEPVQGRWRIQQLASSDHKLVVAGTGTLSGLPVISLSDDCGSDLAQVHVNFPPRNLKIISVDRRTSQIRTDASQCAAWNSGIRFPKPNVDGMANVGLNTAEVRQYGVGATEPYIFYWFAQGANGDRPRACTPAARLACAPPPSNLTLLAKLG